MHSGVPRSEQRHHVARGLAFEAERAQVARDRPAGRPRLDAAELAAAAERRLGRVELDVADIAGSAATAAIDLAAGHDAAADAGAGLDEEEVIGVRPEAPMLRQRHQVHVVVDQRVDAEGFLQPAADVEIVPLAHDRRADHPPALVIDRRRQAEADAEHLARLASGALQQRAATARDLAQDRQRPAGDVDVDGLLREDARPEVGDGDAGDALADIRRQGDGEGLVELQDARRPAAAGLARGGLVDQADLQQLVQPMRHGGARQAGDALDVGPRRRLARQDEREKLPSARGVG